MPRAKKKYHFIYKTTNLKNNKFYIGMHSTSNLEDGYLGSGKRLWFSIRKHGKENFKIEILEYFQTREELAKREKELVNEDLLKDRLCMNLKPGGSGGFCNKEHKINFYKAGNIAYKEKLKNDIDFKKIISNRMSELSRKLWKSGILKYKDNWTGKNHKSETIEKLKGHKRQIGKLNSQFGTIWITNGIENKKIKKENIIPENWYKGRKT